ncbi:hypothetical protein GCM10027570_37230 [Streptomonospora sediminis]
MADQQHAPPRRPKRRAAARGAAVTGVLVAATAVLLGGDGAAWAQGSGAEASTAEIREVVTRLRNVIVALASAVGTLFLTIAGLRGMLAGGDPSQVEAAKRAMSGAGIGYGVAILATVLMAVLDYVVQGG